MAHPDASLLWPHRSRDTKSHTHTIRDYFTGYKKGEIQTKWNQSGGALSHVRDANASAENPGDAGKKCSHHGEHGGTVTRRTLDYLG